jgi:carboxylesterase type B
MFLQYASDEPFLNGELAKQYFEIVSEPKKREIYNAPHALSAEATRERIANHDGLPQWPQYTAEQRATMYFDTPSEVLNDPEAEGLRLIASS